MSIKEQTQQLKNRLDKCKHKLEAARSRADDDMISKFTNEIDELKIQLKSLQGKQDYNLNKERKKLLDMPFSREITKSEQADIGKLKKSVKGMVIVHPMTKLGKLLHLDVMTGFAPKKF
ncbi:YibL family ribosome-associated protein [Vibrio salinus]|uniref:YibL family ribosome-associated protein n=1 Tax=Vibrio salinus TaxID=2899784 RepID=UPI001E3973D2|nr:YibL family ribosome-associated protein [Vibrio salinus]MCE0492432.1 YibL family ribosome-associated protein [Vibrio salinus]